MPLLQNIRHLITGILPTRTRVIVRGRQQLPALAHTLDIDAIHGILREAEAGTCDRLFALYRDIISSYSHFQGEFSKRKLAVIADPLTLIPPGKDPATSQLCKTVEEHLTSLPGWDEFLSHALDSVLYPVSVSERIYRPSDRSAWRYEIAGLTTIPHHHLAWPGGILSLRDTDDNGNFTGARSPLDPAAHIIHRGHLLSSVPDWWGGPMRAVLFWWFFATCDRDWWARFLDRFGAPFLEGRYNSADERGRYELQEAFSAATRLFGIVVSDEARVTMHQANTSQGGDAFQSFAEFANREISKLVIGQTSSSEIQNGGLNSDGQAGAQADVRDDIRRFDSKRLAHTIRTQILAPLWTLNGWPGPIPACTFGSLSNDETEITGELLVALKNAGIRLTEDGLTTVSERLGLGLQFDVPGMPYALSANRLSPSAARQRQARRAIDALAENSAPALARLLTSRAGALSEAIATSASPQQAASSVAALVSSYDPATSAELLQSVLAIASLNAVQTLDA
jgi:phage gp29-like protein